MMVYPGEKVSISDLAIEKTIMCHLGFTEEVSKKHGVAIWRTMDTGMRRFITARTPWYDHDGPHTDCAAV